MPGINKEKYTAEEIMRHNAAYNRLLGIILSDAPNDAVLFRRTLDEELAAGFPVNYTSSNNGGWTLLHWAVSRKGSVSAGLPQILIEAGADVDAQTDGGRTPLRGACWRYVCDGVPEYLAAVNALLAKGAQSELNENWKTWNWTEPDERARRVWLDAYINTWRERRAARERGGDFDSAPVFEYSL